MGKVYGIHELELNPGVDDKSFVQFFNQELIPAYTQMGWKLILLKGDRGQRAGKYGVLFVIESVKERDRWTPAQDVETEESKRWSEEHKEQVESLMKKWFTFSPTDIGSHLEYTDYVEMD
jgi:hypothetical protein